MNTYSYHDLAQKDGLAEHFPLDDKLYSLSGDELKFMQVQTGIVDEAELKRHITEVQVAAYAIYPYPCIRAFRFVQFKLPKLKGYEDLLKIGRERAGSILLDIGCCFGNDVRCAAADGFPVDQIIATDLHPEYWNLGHKLFRSTSESFPVKFIPGDIFDPAHISIIPPSSSPSAGLPPDLSTLTSLNPIRGQVAVIHASSFFHLFDEEKQVHIARALGALLSAEPGSMILGMHGANSQKGLDSITYGTDKKATFHLFSHSPQSWTDLWDGLVFKKGTVKVEASLMERDGMGDRKFLFLHWCVTRL